jgi:hypothetical protein
VFFNGFFVIPIFSDKFFYKNLLTITSWSCNNFTSLLLHFCRNNQDSLVIIPQLFING